MNLLRKIEENIYRTYVIAGLVVLIGLLIGFPILSIIALTIVTIYFSSTNDFKSLKYLLLLMLVQNIVLIIFSYNLSSRDTQILTLIKEIIVYLSIFITIFIKRNFQFEKFDILPIIYIVLIIISFFISDASISAKLVCIRQLFLPIVCFVYGRQVKVKDDDLQVLYNIIIYVGIGIAIFGFIELFFLKDEFWRFIGSEAYFKNKGIEDWTKDGVMVSFYTYDLMSIFGGAVRRFVSIFAEVLATAHFLFLSLAITFFKYKGILRNKIIICGLMLLAIILTISKGVILIMGIAVVVIIYYYYENKKLTLALIALGVIGLVIIVFNSYGEATSTGYHLEGLVHNFQNIKIFGYGLAKSGNFALIYGDSSQNVLSGESFIGTMLGQIGILGTIIYIIYNFVIIKRYIINKHKDKEDSIIALILILGVLLESFLSESAISFLGTGFYFVLAGIIYNKQTMKAKEVNYFGKH